MSKTNLYSTRKPYRFALVGAFFGVFFAFSYEAVRAGKLIYIQTLVQDIGILNPHRTYKNVETYQEFRDSQLFSLLRLPYHTLSELVFPRYSEVRHIHLHIPYKSRRIIDTDRTLARKVGFLDSPKSAQAFMLDASGNLYNAKVRLKGDLGDHWYQNKKFSLRISLSSKDVESGGFPYQYFSIHKLQARQYPYEYIFADALKLLGLPYATHELVKVTVNNQSWGFMDLQEHYGPSFLERQGLKPSSIITFGDDRKWKRGLSDPSLVSNDKDWLSHPRIYVRSSGFVPRKDSKRNQDVLDYIKESIVLPDYQSQLFDNRRLFIADSLLLIWGSFHPMALHNLKFYFNPYTLRLEPILQDQEPFTLLKNLDADHLQIASKGLLRYPKNYSSDFSLRSLNFVQQALINSLKPYAKPFFRDDPPITSTRLQKNFQRLLSIVKQQRKRPTGVHELASSIYGSRIECSGRSLASASEAVHPFYLRYSRGTLSFLNLNCGFVDILRIESCGSTYPLNLRLSSFVDILRPKKITADINLSCSRPPLAIFIDSSGIERAQEIDVIHAVNLSNPLLRERIPSWLKKSENGVYTVSGGTYSVKRPIVVHGTLLVEPGAQLLFEKNAYIVVRGNVHIGRMNSRSVVFKGMNGSWKGAYFYSESGQPSQIKIFNTHFAGADGISDGILELTGGVNVYNSRFESEGLVIQNSRAEDSLNVVQSNILVSNLLIKDSVSDAFDCDYCRGTISGMKAVNIGGDGLDLSGSNVRLDAASFFSIKDKAVSVGEMSNAHLSLIDVEGSYTAVAVKDGSLATVYLRNVSTIGPHVMSYKKKAIYERPVLVKVFVPGDSGAPISSDKYLSAKGTRMYVNNSVVRTRELDVKSLYRSGAMKK